MAIQLAVPVVAQNRPFECWYAAACMVAYYFYPGPRLGVPTVWERSDQSGISPREFVQLAENEGLRMVMLPPVAWTAADLERLLRVCGPIWCAGYWYGSGHVIVLTGVDDANVHFNDPSGGRKRSGSIEWFNARLARAVRGCMLYKARMADGGKH